MSQKENSGLGKILCRLGLHKWGKVEATWIFHQNTENEDVMAKTCQRCGKEKIISYGHPANYDYANRK